MFRVWEQGDSCVHLTKLEHGSDTLYTVCVMLPGRHVHLSNVSLNRVQVICKLVAGVTMHNKLQDTEGEGR